MMHVVNDNISLQEFAFDEYCRVHQKVNNLRGAGLGVPDELRETEKRALDDYRSSRSDAH